MEKADTIEEELLSIGADPFYTEGYKDVLELAHHLVDLGFSVANFDDSEIYNTKRFEFGLVYRPGRVEEPTAELILRPLSGRVNKYSVITPEQRNIWVLRHSFTVGPDSEQLWGWSTDGKMALRYGIGGRGEEKWTYSTADLLKKIEEWYG